MKLLDPRDINRDKSQTLEESMQRTNALAAEESRLARAINKARDNAKKIIEKVEADFAEYKAEVDRKRTALSQEVASLEARREEALKPIGKLKKTAEKLVSDAQTILADAKREKASVEADRETNKDIAEALQDRSDDLDAREKKISTKESIIKAEQNRQAESAKTLADEWFTLGQATTAHNAKVTENAKERERLVTIETAQNIRAVKQDERDKELDDKDEGIKDKYRTLIASTEEIKKQHGLKT